MYFIKSKIIVYWLAEYKKPTRSLRMGFIKYIISKLLADVFEVCGQRQAVCISTGTILRHLRNVLDC